MTEYELVDAAGTFHGPGMTTLMAYFSVLSAYLLVAYLAGRSLSRFQTIVLTGMYMVMQLIVVWSATSYLAQGRSFLEMADSVVAGGGLPLLKPQHLALVLLSVGVVAGLKFMWDVWHPRV